MTRAPKKARREGRLIAFIDEKGVSTRPHRVRTWAPRGRTPVIREPERSGDSRRQTFGWKSLSVIGAIRLWRMLFRITTYGLLKAQGTGYLNTLFRSMGDAGLVRTDAGEYPLLTLTDLGEKVMRGAAKCRLSWPPPVAAGHVETLSDQGFDGGL